MQFKHDYNFTCEEAVGADFHQYNQIYEIKSYGNISVFRKFMEYDFRSIIYNHTHAF